MKTETCEHETYNIDCADCETADYYAALGSEEAERLADIAARAQFARDYKAEFGRDTTYWTAIINEAVASAHAAGIYEEFLARGTRILDGLYADAK